MSGNSAKASSGINIAFEEDVDSLIEDTLKSGQGHSDPKLVKLITVS